MTGDSPSAAPASKASPTPTLRADELTLFDSTVVAISSVGPAYSLAATLSLLFVAVAYAGPAVIIVSFIPVLLIAVAYFYLNRRERHERHLADRDDRGGVARRDHTDHDLWDPLDSQHPVVLPADPVCGVTRHLNLGDHQSWGRSPTGIRGVPVVVA